MTSQNLPVIKTITSTEQFDYFKKQLSIYYFPSSFYQEKVDKIKQEISEGKYKVNVEQLARRIVQFEGELFDRKWLM